MSYKIPNIPSPRAYKEEIADFWEIQALRNPNMDISNARISRIITPGLDEINHEGIESEDDEVASRLDEVFIELQRRQHFSSGKYPFTFKKYSIKLNIENNINKIIYLFLLLCTRFNMNKHKVQNGIDATLLFEELCAQVVINYFGESSNSFVFGTANPGNFERKVNDLIAKVGEGQAFKNPNNNLPTKNDDAVDIIAWKDFADRRDGKIIAFGQCKTGTSWPNEIQRLKPGNFCDNWFYNSPILDPLPLVFICDTLNEELNFHSSQRGYLFFNRFRILEYIENNLSHEIRERIDNWLEGAKSNIEIIE